MVRKRSNTLATLIAFLVARFGVLLAIKKSAGNTAALGSVVGFTWAFAGKVSIFDYQLFVFDHDKEISLILHPNFAVVVRCGY